jgi:anti-sigma B factor antagonist
MSLTLDTRTSATGVMIIEAKGKITIGEGDVQLRHAIKELLEKGHKKLILSLEGIKYMDSAGVGELVSTYTSVKNANGKLYLVGVTGKILGLLEITQLLRVFEVYTNISDALAEMEE